MKMTPTPTPVVASDYAAYTHYCQRGACDPAWLAPLPGVSYLQLYADFGDTPPIAFEVWLQSACQSGHSEQVFPANYVVGQTPEGNWYGVFKYFASPLTPFSVFVAWLSVVVETEAGLDEKTFFTEVLILETCLPLTKIASCYPQGATTTGFDINDIFYGLPQGDTYLGLPGIRYFHTAYVRKGKVRELSNKATFTTSLVRNFRTTLERIYQIETELVPQWFKDVLLAIYMRGAVQINNGTTYLLSELAVDPINDNDAQWKPWAQLRRTNRLYFGCDDSRCVDCCSPEVIFATAVGGVLPTTNFIINGDGTPLINASGDHLIHL